MLIEMLTSKPIDVTGRSYFIAPVVPPIAGPIPDPLLNWITELSNVSADQRWVLLTNLKAAAAYQFRVSAVNSVGEGSPSEPSNSVMLPQEGKNIFYGRPNRTLCSNDKITVCNTHCLTKNKKMSFRLYLSDQ